MDIQRFLDNYFQNKAMPFIVGTKKIQNLFSNSDILQAGRFHFFCDPIQRRPTRNQLGKVTGYSATINFCLCRTSTIDMPYMNETNQTIDNKYTTNIEPIIIEWNAIVKDFGCSGFGISNESYVDTINVQDVNFDGIIGTITLTSYDA
jgi:hypothetical protein